MGTLQIIVPLPNKEDCILTSSMVIEVSYHQTNYIKRLFQSLVDQVEDTSMILYLHSSSINERKFIISPSMKLEYVQFDPYAVNVYNIKEYFRIRNVSDKNKCKILIIHDIYDVKTDDRRSISISTTEEVKEELESLSKETEILIIGFCYKE